MYLDSIIVLATEGRCKALNLLRLPFAGLLAGTRFGFPYNLTLSVTGRCNSKCKTCRIWANNIYENNEMTVEQYVTLFEQLRGKLYWVTISGGEPFIRPDLTQIVNALCEITRVNIVNIPTNGILTGKIHDDVEEIVYSNPRTEFVLNLSIDGVDKLHDEIRGVPRNWDILIMTLEKLKQVREEHDNLRIGAHTVVSKYNIYDITADRLVLNGLGVDDIIYEIAEQRVELFNTSENLLPEKMSLEMVFKTLSNLEVTVRKDLLGHITQKIRHDYYRSVLNGLNEQMLPCYAGRASIQIMPNGDVVPCCVRCNIVGNVNETSLEDILKSTDMVKVTESIKSEVCACPLMNAYYTSYLSGFGAIKRLLL